MSARLARFAAFVARFFTGTDSLCWAKRSRPSRKLLTACCVAAFVSISAAELRAAAPWSSLISANRVSCDPNEDYFVKVENGPWMIVACSFSGDGAHQQAKELVLELRKRYKLEAYLYKVRFDRGETIGRGIDRFGQPQRMRYLHGGEIEEYAVLVGNYRSVDDPEAQRTLQKIKYARPECLEIKEGKVTHQSLAGWRMLQRQVHEMIGSEKRRWGPMGRAFLAPNPLLPKEALVPPGLDPLVEQMNRDVQHSLLKCPGKYSVLVATFKGKEALTPEEFEKMQRSKPGQTSDLAMAALKAHVLTEALRMKGWEAYEFHDRYASIVTIGSFDSVGTPRPDGRIELDPRIYTIMQTFGGGPVEGPGGVGGVRVKKIGPLPEVGEIYFDPQPIPVQVPKKSIGSAYSQPIARDW